MPLLLPTFEGEPIAVMAQTPFADNDYPGLGLPALSSVAELPVPRALHVL